MQSSSYQKPVIKQSPGMAVIHRCRQQQYGDLLGDNDIATNMPV